MDYESCVKQGLNGEAKLKLILCGGVEKEADKNIGVVSVVYATEDSAAARKKLAELSAQNPRNYYMGYSVPLDMDLTKLSHYPSIAIAPEDLAEKE